LLLHHPHWGLMPGRHWCGGHGVAEMEWLTCIGRFPQSSGARELGL
jgi:hypothetical protein